MIGLAAIAITLYVGVSGPIRVSPETTIITAPLLPDGRPDYIAYLNATLGADVTPEKNIAVNLAQINGLERMGENRDFAFRALGISSLSPKLPILSWHSFLTEHIRTPERTRDLRQLLSDAPESIDFASFPEVGDYLQILAPVFEELEAGIAKPVYFFPCGNDRGEVLADPLLSTAREVSRLLHLRAMFSVYHDRIDDAMRDLATMLRLARLLQRHPSGIAHSCAGSIELEVMHATLALSWSGQLNSSLLEKFRNELSQFPVRPSPQSGLPLIDSMLVMHSLTSLKSVPRPQDFAPYRGSFEVQLGRLQNLNHLLQRATRGLNELRESAADLNPRSRTEKLASREHELQAWWLRFEQEFERDPASARERWKRTPVEFVDETYADVAVGSLAILIAGSDRRADRWRLFDAALVLAEYRTSHERFPMSLAELPPELFQKLPLDFWTGEPLGYRQADEGFTLWSCGVNGRNEGGWYRLGDFEGPDGADDVRLGLRPPVPPKPLESE